MPPPAVPSPPGPPPRVPPPDAFGLAALETQRGFVLLDSEVRGVPARVADGVTVAPTGLPDAQWNVAWIDRPPRDPDAAVAALRSTFERLRVPYSVWVGEWLDDEDGPLTAALAAWGHRRLIRMAVHAMDLTTGQIDSGATPPGVRITTVPGERRRASDEATFEEFTAFSTACFGLSPQEWSAYLRPRWGDGRITDVVARADGRIVAAVSVVAPEADRPGPSTGVRVFNLGTVPEWRGRGLGRAVLGAALDLAATAGHGHATLSPSSQGRPLYQRMGFTEIAALVVWLP